MSKVRREGGGSGHDDEVPAAPAIGPGKRSGTAGMPNQPAPKYPGKRTLTQHFAPRPGREPTAGAPREIPDAGGAGVDPAGEQLDVSPEDAAAHAIEHKGSGEAVDPTLAAAVGGQTGTDVRHARVHKDPLSQAATRAMGARAFAHQHDIFLGPGESASDPLLLAHELAHVAQQQGATPTPQRKLTVGAANSPAEQHADRVAAQVVAGTGATQLLVDAGPLVDGQMLKAQFIDVLRVAIVDAVEQELGKLGVTAGCPFIDRYFEKYGNQPAAAGESLIRHWIPTAKNARSATDLVPLVLVRVREGVRAWQASGRLPPELAAADPALASEVAQASPTQAQRSSLEGLESDLGPGAPLDGETAAKMSRGLGVDVSAARIHTGPVASAKAAEHDATAFAVGNNVVMGASAPSPGTIEGDALLAHELAHTAQQKDAAADPIARRRPIGTEDPAAEGNADRAAAGAGPTFGDVLKTGLQLQRCPGGGVDPAYQRTVVDGPDRGRVVAVSQPPQNVKQNTDQFIAIDTIGVTKDEAQAFALAKTAGVETAVIPSSGKYFVYEIEAFDLQNRRRPGDAALFLDPRTAGKGRTTPVRIESGVLALINRHGAVYRAGDLGSGSKLDRPESGSATDPFQAYRELNNERGGIEKLSEPELLATFHGAMTDTALTVLEQSEAQAREKHKQFTTPGSTTSGEHDEIEATAKEILPVQQQIESTERHIQLITNTPSDQDTHDLPPDFTAGLQELQQKRQALILEKRQKLMRFPMLGRYETTKELSSFLAKPRADRERALGGDASSVLTDIGKTRESILAGRLNLWKVQSIVDATMAGLGIRGNSKQAEQINTKAKAQKKKDAIENIAIGVFSIGFAIAAMAFSGGTSLAFTAGAVGLGLYDALHTTLEYQKTNAAANTSLDWDGGLLSADEKMHWGWLVVAWAGVALDIVDVAKAARIVKAAPREVQRLARHQHKSVADAAAALAQGDQKLLAKLRRAAGDAQLTDTVTEALRPGLSSRVGAEITIDAKLGSEVRVLYDVADDGRTFVTGVRVGPAARVGDIVSHAETVKMLDQYSLKTSKLRELWNRVRSFGGMKDAKKNPFEPRSQAFNSWQELEKLQPRVVRWREATLDEMLARNAKAPDLQAALRTEIKFLDNEVDIHSRVVARLVFERGDGVVAMSDATREGLRSGMRLPDVPHKGADDITEEELRNSRYFFKRKDDGSFEQVTKVGHAAPTPPPRTFGPRPGEDLDTWGNRLKQEGITGIDPILVRARGTDADALAARGELRAAERASARGHSVEMLTPPHGPTAQGVKSPEAKLLRNGEERTLEAKTATSPPDRATWNKHADNANKQIKSKKRAGEISFDWTEVDLNMSADFRDVAAIESFMNGKMTVKQLRIIHYFEIVWRDSNGVIRITSRTRNASGAVDAVTTRSQ